MTSNSAFKKAVRARMLDTGENYTTAAHAVRGRLDVVQAPPDAPALQSYDELPEEWACPECGAANKYYCNCRYASNHECDECGAVGGYGCNC